MNNKSYIWNFFLSDIKNEYGVAGLMGNLQAESGLLPNNLENAYEQTLGYTDETYTNAVDNGTYSESSFVNDSAGYGLAQWTYYTRKQGLYNLYKSGNYSSIGSIELACDYLLYELKNSYPDVYNTLKETKNIRTASDKVLHDFENPADQSELVEKFRCGLSESIYEEMTGLNPPPDEPEIVVKKKSKFNLIFWKKIKLRRNT